MIRTRPTGRPSRTGKRNWPLRNAEAYRVFIAAEVIATLRSCPRREQKIITQLIDQLADDPFRKGDFVERDEIGRPIQVLITGRRAVCFWADHPVKELKIIDLKPIGH